MKLDVLCGRVKPSCPQLKSQSAFIDHLFEAAGQRLHISDSYKRKLFNGDKGFVNDLKAQLRGNDNLESITRFFMSEVADERVIDLTVAFGIPETGEPDKKALCVALAHQMKLMIDSDDEDVDDIVGMQYQAAKETPTGEAATPQTMRPIYPGDGIYMRPASGKVHKVGLDETFEHTWAFDNTGTQTWIGRRLYLSNHGDIRPRAESNYIDVPETPPNKTARVSVRMNSRSFEAKSECRWIMIDENGKECFPNSRIFMFVVEATFRAES